LLWRARYRQTAESRRPALYGVAVCQKLELLQSVASWFANVFECIFDAGRKYSPESCEKKVRKNENDFAAFFSGNIGNPGIRAEYRCQSRIQ
jgi:hypothetical protein